MALTKGVKILSIEAKDLYNSNHLEYDNPIGYDIRNKDGVWNKNLFINTLDYSLDLIKLREVYERVYRRQDFSSKIGKHNYTKHVINVKFKYSHKEYNKAGKNRYVLAGYQWRDIKDKISDCVYIDNGKLIAIETNQPINSPCDSKYLREYFEFDDGKYITAKSFKNLLSKSELREELYANGFVCDGTRYIRWKRSSGSSRVGKCLFINEALYSRIHRWELCGVNAKEGTEIDLAALEAYISLTLSSIVDTIELRPENFLVIDDYESVFKDTVVGVEYENGELMAREQEYEICNSIFDGQTLLDESCFPDKYKKYSMLLLRQRMFKSACFKTKIQQWFADNNITDVSQLNGFTMATDIKDIKLITTPSSIKFTKFGKLQQWLKKLEPTFGIVKHEKPTHYFDGRMVQCHYQLINTLQLSEQNVIDLLKPSLDYIRLIRSNPAVLRYHIKYPYDYMDDEISPINTKNEIIFKLLGMNDKFAKTKLYLDFRNDLIKSMLRELKQGHVLINGNYSTLFGNGYEMLQQSIGTFKGESIIGVGNIHSKRFEYNKTILGSRSPHVCSGNVLLVNNVANEEIDKYFPLSPEVVYINAINENIQQRLNGADYDSDTILLTDNQMFIEKAKQNYDKFKVPTCFVSAKKIKRYYTNEQKADLDVKTSVNKIGEDINLSQMLNSIMWDNISNGQTVEDNTELYHDICKLAVLSGVEIDKAKREYAVDVGKEINLLKKKYQRIEKIKDSNGTISEKLIKPMFFKMITLENGYELNEKHNYRYFNTPMDYLQKEISKFNFFKSRESKDDIIPFSELLKPANQQWFSGFYYHQRNRIIEIIRANNQKIKELYIGYDYKNKEDKAETKLIADELKQECVDYINNTAICEGTMYLLLSAIDKKKYSDIKNRVFVTLFGTPNDLFFKILQNNSGVIEKIVESPDGNIDIYDYKFKEIPIKPQ